MAILSGKFGYVNGATRTSEWGMSILDSGEDHTDSSTLAGHLRISGIVDSNGYFHVNGGAPLVYPGSYFLFEGYPAPSDGIYGSSGNLWVVDLAILDSLAITWTWAKEGKLSSVYNFSQGTACPTVGSGYISDDEPNIPNQMCSLAVKISTNDSDYYPYLGITNAVFTLSCANHESNTSYSGCCTHRIPGIMDWTLAITEENDYNNVGLAGTVNIGDIVSFQLYDSAISCWNLNWGILQNWSNLVVDVATGRIIQKTANYAMCGFVAGVPGEISYGANILWPPSI
jgi:hypothetical protein